MSRILLLFISAVTVCTSGAVNASVCSKNSLSVQVVDEISGERAASIAEVSDPVLRNFASIISLHVERLLQTADDCVGEGVNHSDLLFVRKPLVQNRTAKPLPGSFGGSTFNGCHLSSPWVDFEFDNSVAPKARGVIRWSQRQLLIDQAIMAGDVQAADTRVVVLNDDEFREYAKAYADLEIVRKSETISLSSPIPPDILWLFRNSLQSTRGPFSLAVRGSMHKLMEQTADEYANLLISLIDRCASSGQGELRYENILDLKDVVPIDKYKIDALIK
jgi:hypothetical protein